MKEELETRNLAEVAVLLQHHNSILDISIKEGVYGIPEISVRMSGTYIHIDHETFITSGGARMELLPDMFKELTSRIWEKEEKGGLL